MNHMVELVHNACDAYEIININNYNEKFSDFVLRI